MNNTERAGILDNRSGILMLKKPLKKKQKKYKTGAWQHLKTGVATVINSPKSILFYNGFTRFVHDRNFCFTRFVN